MTDLHHHPQRASRRRQSAAAPVKKSSAMPVATPTARPVDVQVRIGGRWIAGQALSHRADQVLVSHHGHLVWVDQQSVRTP